MSDQFLAEIRMFSCTFAPMQWAFCNGQLLPISANTALFALIGTLYGGDGRSTFQLPNLQGNVPVNAGQGSGLSSYQVGEQGGSPTVTLLDTENPAHNHQVNAHDFDGTSPDPAGKVYGKGGYVTGSNTVPLNMYIQTAPPPSFTLNPLTIGIAGGSQPHNNVMPSLPLNFCIAMQGIYPARG